MIRRISKVNDLKDIIKSCPSGVIDDITSIKYFIQGHPETEIEAEFEKVGTHLEAILPTSALETLSNGILMRRALYKVEDSSYPDGYYNLEFLDDMNVWLGDEETEDPFDPGYLTEGDLKTINGESLVGVGNIDVVNYIPDYYATKSWVSEQGYLTSHQDLTGYATESWVSSNFLSTTALTGYATESWVSSNFLSTTALTGYATESWVEAQGYITSAGLSGLATQSWVLSQNYLNSLSLTGYATESWVTSNIRNFVTEENVLNILSVNSYITESWVSSQQFATQSWVSGQGYLTSHQDLTGYATESWVSDQQFATQAWVSTQGYLEESKIWCGTASQWNNLTSEEQATYKIALVTA